MLSPALYKGAGGVNSFVTDQIHDAYALATTQFQAIVFKSLMDKAFRRSLCFTKEESRVMHAA